MNNILDSRFTWDSNWFSKDLGWVCAKWLGGQWQLNGPNSLLLLLTALERRIFCFCGRSAPHSCYPCFIGVVSPSSYCPKWDEKNCVLCLSGVGFYHMFQPFLCPRKIYTTITLPEANNILPLKINGWFRWISFWGVKRPIFRCKLAVSFREGIMGIYSHTKERCAFNCRFFRNVLNATGTAQGAWGCWWMGWRSCRWRR